MKRIIGVVVACLFVFSLVSCSALKKSEIVGTYELINLDAGGITYNEEQLDEIRSYGKNATLEIRDDDTATLDLFGVKSEMTYKASTGIFVLKGENVKGTYKNGIFTLKDNLGTMEFRKIS